MRKALLISGLVALNGGCVRHKPSWTGQVQWPDERSSASVLPFTEAGAAVAAAGALREVIQTNPHPLLFHGCASPEQGLDVAVFTGPTTGLYYVAVEQRFSRCGGPNGRVLDWWQVYAVTPQGEVVAKAPRPPTAPMEVQPDAAEAPADSPAPPTQEQAPPAEITNPE
ncbi:hypothetical protein ACIHQR_04445 [Corallococcus coralloides]|uniref:hypothetical protein n=1 Tax=Corallococcus coralloides TaxID=184914 RepID=UPI00384DB19C